MYQLVTTDMEKLADTISYLLRPSLAGVEEDLYEKFLLDQQDFWDKHCGDEIEPVCQGLLLVFEKMLESGF